MSKKRPGDEPPKPLPAPAPKDEPSLVDRLKARQDGVQGQDEADPTDDETEAAMLQVAKKEIRRIQRLARDGVDLSKDDSAVFERWSKIFEDRRRAPKKEKSPYDLGKLTALERVELERLLKKARR